MTTEENPGPDDPMFAHMREQLSDISVPDELIVSELTDVELLDKLAEIRQRLLNLGEMIHVKTEQGRELHSQRSALIIERNKRFPVD